MRSERRRATPRIRRTSTRCFLEERRYPPPPEFAAQANAKPEIYDEAFEAFWEREGRERVTWFEPFTKLYEWERPYAKWFLGGKLNIAYNCVDRHVEAGRGDKVAYYWEGEPDGDRRAITYADLQREVVRCANALKALGVGKGTPVGIYMGMVPEAPVAMLACARLGAPHTVVFGGFSADSLSDRLERHGLRGADHAGRGVAPRHDGAAEADGRRGDGGRAGVEQSLVLRRTGGDVPMTEGRDHWWHELATDDSRLPARADGLRGPALPALHLGHDRQAEGDRAHDGRATSSASRRPTTTSSTSSPTPTSTGARPTSAGSPGTATSSTGRSATARRR